MAALCKILMKTYIVELNGKRIGTSLLDKADAPMGVVFGSIEFEGISRHYEFLSNYCRDNNVQLNEDNPELEAIFTKTINGLSVFNEEGVEIKGVGSAISGFLDEGYEVEILGIPYPFYEEEFPHHRETYENQFK
jgi:hypothetical protein